MEHNPDEVKTNMLDYSILIYGREYWYVPELGTFVGYGDSDTVQVVSMSCQHEHVTWPQSGWQACTDCGARREYSDIGVEPGPWITTVEVIQQEEKPDNENT